MGEIFVVCPQDEKPVSYEMLKMFESIYDCITFFVRYTPALLLGGESFRQECDLGMLYLPLIDTNKLLLNNHSHLCVSRWGDRLVGSICVDMH